jgi:hypothetical protein
LGSGCRYWFVGLLWEKKGQAMKRRIALFAATFAISMLIGIQAVEVANANPINQKAGYEVITIDSPKSLTFSSSNSITLTFKCHTNFVANYLSYCYTMDGSGATLYGNVWHQMLKVEQKIINQTVISNGTSNSRTEPYLPYTDYEIEIIAILSSLGDGNHRMSLYRGPNYDFSGAVYPPVLNVTFTVNTSADGTKDLKLSKISPDTTPNSSQSMPTINKGPTLPVELTPPLIHIVLAIVIVIIAVASISLVYFKKYKPNTE